MNLQQIERQQSKKSLSLAGYECIDRPSTNDGGGCGHPRCLATLPSNIEELIQQFKMQENRLCMVNQTYIE